MSKVVALYGDFIEKVRDTGLTSGRILMDEWCGLATEERWNEYRKLPLDRELVLQLAGYMAQGFSNIIRGTCSENLYYKRINEGHEFLKEMHDKARELGIDVDISEIDGPLAPTEWLVQSGCARYVDPE